jgi:GNAT superfamily N-acetyltransferase
VLIQRLTTADGPRLRDIRLRALLDAPDAFVTTFEESAARPPEYWTEQLANLATFVAVSEEGDVGLVRGGPYVGKPAAAILLSMWVAPKHRGSGVGDALIDSVIGWARAEGYKRLLLDVGNANAHAISLYERKGFKSTGQASSYPRPSGAILEHERELSL